jgi:hypothetical protein
MVDIANPDNTDQTIRVLSLLSKEIIVSGKLKTLWEMNRADTRVKQAFEKALDTQDQALLRLLARYSGLGTAQIKQSLSRAVVRFDFQIDDYQRSVKLSKRKASKKSLVEKGSRTPVGLAELISNGLIKPPFVLEVKYKGQTLFAKILGDATVEFDGESYTSLSVAGGMARVKVSGPPGSGRTYYQTNGWTFWKYRDSKGILKPIDELRQRYLATGGRALEIV